MESLLFRRGGRGGFSSVIRFEERSSPPAPFHSRPYSSSLSLSLVSQPGSLLVKIQFVAAHRMENKKKRPLNWRYVMAAT